MSVAGWLLWRRGANEEEEEEEAIFTRESITKEECWGSLQQRTDMSVMLARLEVNAGRGVSVIGTVEERVYGFDLCIRTLFLRCVWMLYMYM